MNPDKLAVLFPGIGYTCDKPLLYYSAKLAASNGYRVVPVRYSGFPKKIVGDAGRMKESLDIACSQAESLLKEVKWESFEKIVFFGKSIGTIAAAWYASEKSLSVRSVVYTPLAETFTYLQGDSIIFHGTSDQWVNTEVIKECCLKRSLPLYLTESANHSLETGDVKTDIGTLQKTMEIVDRFLCSDRIPQHPGQ